ncbi:MAG TPA: histidine kinase [Aggregatilineaceae bacterium]|nr:histidine kinase [Aggregatilineaceae bacterium]
MIGYRLVTPYDGVQTLPGEWVYNVDGVEVMAPDNPDIQWDDQVVAIEGRPLVSWAEMLLQPQAVRPHWEVGQTVTYTVLRGTRRLEIPIRLLHYPLGRILSTNWPRLLILALFAVMSTFLLVRRPGIRSVRVLYLWISCFVETIALAGIGLQVSDLVNGTSFWLQYLSQHLTLLLAVSGFLHFSLVFPSRQSIVRQEPWIIPLIYVVPFILYGLLCILSWPGSSSILDWLGRWIETYDLLTAFVLICALVSLLANYRRVRRQSPASQGARLVLMAHFLCATIFVFLVLAHFIAAGGLYSKNSATWLFLTFGLVTPVALFVAVVRYRLFRVQLIVNRTLVYTSLSLVIVGLYVIIVGALSQLFDVAGSFVISLVATGVIATVAPLLRERIQRAVNRLMYGERDDPYTVLSHLGQRLEGTLAPDAVFPILVETVAQSLKLPYAAIALKRDTAFAIAASRGAIQPNTVSLPILYQGEAIGQLVAAARGPGETFSPADHRLLASLAQQAGVAAHTAQLTAALQRSRERLVTTREEERLRLRRDLHDGIGPALAGIMLKLGAARKRLVGNAPSADELLEQMTTDMEGVVGDVRRLAQELRPSALDELGLAAALRRYVLQLKATCAIGFTFEAPEHVPHLPAATEVAIYRITSEAVTNVVRHSQALNCVVRLIVDQGLTVEVCDDGRGITADHRIGVGLHSMRERAEELGGTFTIESRPESGTQIRAHFPLSTAESLGEPDHGSH